ncbi:hypothetical protein A2949_01390 [Candidatus Adlerbacteria bacterium RIFCSPLOWO2_01_FULL_54_21b]|uniref:Lipopolysaccharide assembly protein A domain-containing protein n=1 Tax=Candidatus Adlerbacteria bacterium RIFCSPLOWO2_01_FULL_54_21b TaxID=1797245 RepID=A0A1F4XYV9_9BACT|nr:MAG: hypothetical protein A2949_01390 [Candidatus Adlerbacteria bacterium RIFCSPLOWO2_01_FULL_54_21b]
MIFSLILGILLGVVSVIFVLQNISVVTVTFLDWQIAGSLALVLLLAIICGIVMTLLVLLPSLIRGDFYLSTLKRQKKDVEDELASTKCALQAASPSMRGETVIAEKTAKT